MGLDVGWYTRLTKLPTPTTPEEWDRFHDSGALDLWENEDFPFTLEPLEPGFYECREGGSFQAGSYGTYGLWRRWLCKTVLGKEIEQIRYGSYNVKDPQPFYQLLNYSDCEGVLGTMVCEKLAQDFRVYEEKARYCGEPHDLVRYRDFADAFERASDGGCVVFF